jgi:hypothetical protein
MDDLGLPETAKALRDSWQPLVLADLSHGLVNEDWGVRLALPDGPA